MISSSPLSISASFSGDLKSLRCESSVPVNHCDPKWVTSIANGNSVNKMERGKPNSKCELRSQFAWFESKTLTGHGTGGKHYEYNLRVEKLRSTIWSTEDSIRRDAKRAFVKRRMRQSYTRGQKDCQTCLYKRTCLEQFISYTITRQSPWHALLQTGTHQRQPHKLKYLVEYFCHNCTDYYKIECSKALLCNTFSQDGPLFPRTPPPRPIDVIASVCSVHGLWPCWRGLHPSSASYREFAFVR